MIKMPHSIRSAFGHFAPALATMLVLAVARSPAAEAAPPRIDRRALVARHNVTLTKFDVTNPLSVGNGGFAVTVDATGLQTFATNYARAFPLCIMSDWGWHSSPNPNGWTIDNFPFVPFDTHGRAVPYADQVGEANNFLRNNPHRLDLGQLGFVLTKKDGQPAQMTDLADVRQTLDLWTATISSHFTLEGDAVDVRTVCHPDSDEIAVRVESPLVGEGRIGVFTAFPYGSPQRSAADWNQPNAHTTTVSHPWADSALFARKLDADTYWAAAAWSAGARFSETGPHRYLVTPAAGSKSFEFCCRFSPTPPPAPPADFAATAAAVVKHWSDFWSTGGAIDLSSSRDPRWMELERRIVLSEYLTAIQSAGRTPPQETGLSFNSWNGKFHLEMHWLHAAHFALWGRLPLLEKSLGFYSRILERARSTAQKQGYAGARWPKMTDPSGAESPSKTGPFLIWQEPHPIYYAELAYRDRGDRATLAKYRDVVFQTAEFMASFAWKDPATGEYVLGPPLKSAQETLPRETTANPAFELAYWRWGLETAQKWRERLGLPRDPRWDDVIRHLSPFPVSDGKYLFTATTPDSYSNPKWSTDHPAVLMAMGFLPGEGIDRATMSATLDWIWDHWNWPSAWGWDCPMVAMTAARLGEPARAIDALLRDTPKNVFTSNGHNFNTAGFLNVYLPGNGALLAATAMMAAGWDGAPPGNAPGFPADGSWTVKWEGLKKAP